MLRFIFFSLLVIITFHISSAQEIIQGIDEYLDYEHIVRNMAKPGTYENVKGSPFLNKDFIEGQIKLTNGKTYKGPLRYDIYSDEIEFTTSGGEIYVVRNPETIQFATIGDANFNYFEPGEFKDIKGFYQILVIGNYSLYKKYEVVLKDPRAARPYEEAKPATFVTKDSKYVIMDTEGNFTDVKNKKDLLLPGLDNAKLENFIKSNKIKTGDEKDMIQFVEFLNQ